MSWDLIFRCKIAKRYLVQNASHFARQYNIITQIPGLGLSSSPLMWNGSYDSSSYKLWDSWSSTWYSMHGCVVFQLYLVFSCVETVIQAQAGSLCTGKAKSPTLAEQLIPYSFTEKLTSWWEISRWLDHISCCLVCWSRCQTRAWKKKSNWEHPRRDSSLCSIPDKENAAGNRELPWQQALCVPQNC